MDFDFDFGGQQDSLGIMEVYADIVYCIDLTSSMSPIISKVKETALTLHQNLQEVMRTKYQRSIKQLRIKVIGFRDAYCDGPCSFVTSRFFNLPSEAVEFKSFVDKLQAKGGGDVPENSLEALAMAMQSDWCKTIDDSIRKRHIIVMFTDASAHPLEKAADGVDENYPPNMPKNYSEIIDWWCGQGSLQNPGAVSMNGIAKRIALFVPEDSEPWKDVKDDFDNSCVKFIATANGGRDITTDDLLSILGETMV